MTFGIYYFCSPQDGKIRLYSVQGNTLKADGQILETKGGVTDMAYSNNGAYLGVTDDKKVATIFTVADGYSVNVLRLFQIESFGVSFRYFQYLFIISSQILF